MQIERLVQMIFYIVRHGRVTAKELAGFFNVSTRTVYRDINTLSVAGIPVVSARGSGGGIFLMDGYAIDRSVFSEEERQTICQSLQILQAARYPDAETAWNKICSVFRNAPDNKWLDVDFSDWGSGENEKHKISDLQYAVLNRRVIRFRYFNSELEQSVRTVEPLQLAFKSRAWYLAGYCRKRKEVRTFRLSRIKDLQVMPESFSRELPLQEPVSLASGCKTTCGGPQLKLKFSPKIAYRLFDEFQESQVILKEDGFYYVTAPYEPGHWILHYLLSFGTYVEIIEPETARAALRERACDLVALYS